MFLQYTFFLILTVLLLYMSTDSGISSVLRKCEKVCKMPRTNGSSCIMYGVPVKCSNVPDKWTENKPDDL